MKTLDIVGHKKSVSCVRFAPTCRYKPKSKDEIASVLANESSSATPCCAIGSRDRSISVWLTSLKRPLVVIHDLFEDSILDLTWDSKGPGFQIVHEISSCDRARNRAYSKIKSCIKFQQKKLGGEYLHWIDIQ